MAYDNTHLVKLAALKALAEKVKSDYALKTELSALSDKVDELVTAGGEPNKLEGCLLYTSRGDYHSLQPAHGDLHMVQAGHHAQPLRGFAAELR